MNRRISDTSPEDFEARIAAFLQNVKKVSNEVRYTVKQLNENERLLVVYVLGLIEKGEFGDASVYERLGGDIALDRVAAIIRGENPRNDQKVSLLFGRTLGSKSLATGFESAWKTLEEKLEPARSSEIAQEITKLLDKHDPTVKDALQEHLYDKTAQGVVRKMSKSMAGQTVYLTEKEKAWVDGLAAVSQPESQEKRGLLGRFLLQFKAFFNRSIISEIDFIDRVSSLKDLDARGQEIMGHRAARDQFNQLPQVKAQIDQITQKKDIQFVEALVEKHAGIIKSGFNQLKRKAIDEALQSIEKVGDLSAMPHTLLLKEMLTALFHEEDTSEVRHIVEDFIQGYWLPKLQDILMTATFKGAEKYAALSASLNEREEKLIGLLQKVSEGEDSQNLEREWKAYKADLRELKGRFDIEEGVNQAFRESEMKAILSDPASFDKYKLDTNRQDYLFVDTSCSERKFSYLSYQKSEKHQQEIDRLQWDPDQIRFLQRGLYQEIEAISMRISMGVVPGGRGIKEANGLNNLGIKPLGDKKDKRSYPPYVLIRDVEGNFKIVNIYLSQFVKITTNEDEEAMKLGYEIDNTHPKFYQVQMLATTISGAGLAKGDDIADSILEVKVSPSLLLTAKEVLQMMKGDKGDFTGNLNDEGLSKLLDKFENFLAKGTFHSDLQLIRGFAKTPTMTEED